MSDLRFDYLEDEVFALRAALSQVTKERDEAVKRAETAEYQRRFAMPLMLGEISQLTTMAEQETAEEIAAWAERELDDEVAMWIRRGDWRTEDGESGDR